MGTNKPGRRYIVNKYFLIVLGQWTHDFTMVQSKKLVSINFKLTGRFTGHWDFFIFCELACQAGVT